MKKYYILLFCVAVLFAATGIYLDVYVKLQSIYWLAAKWIVLFGIILAAILVRIHRKQSLFSFQILWVVIWAIMTGDMFYRDTKEYKLNVCQDKFGPEFNARRRSLGIPVIPEGWKVDSRNNHSAEWQSKDSVACHKNKTITVDSTCTLIAEHDEYYLKPLHGKSRDVSVLTKYARGMVIDSMIFNYYGGDSTLVISRYAADSIFAAEKIKKDY